MNNLRPQKISRAVITGANTSARWLLALLLACACGAVGVSAQVHSPDTSSRRESRQQDAGKKGSPAAVEDDDDAAESESQGERADVFAPPPRDPATILRKAHFVYVRSDSVFISGNEVEDSLRKRKEFQAWGMVITRNEAEADLIVQITRKPLTRRFTFTVIDPRTMEVVASGKTRSVIFGKKIANKVAEKFANRVKVYRPYPPG